MDRESALEALAKFCAKPTVPISTFVVPFCESLLAVSNSIVGNPVIV